MEIFIVNTFIYQKFDNLTVFMCQEDTWACGLSFSYTKAQRRSYSKAYVRESDELRLKDLLW